MYKGNGNQKYHNYASTTISNVLKISYLASVRKTVTSWLPLATETHANNNFNKRLTQLLWRDHNVFHTVKLILSNMIVIDDSGCHSQFVN